MTHGITKSTHIRKVKPGDSISAAHYNMLVDGVTELQRLVEQLMSRTENTILNFVEITEDVDQYERDKSGDMLAYDNSISAGSDPYEKRDDGKTFIADSGNSIWLTGERVLLYWHAPFGTHIPVPYAKTYIGKLDGALTQGSSATMSVWKYNGSSFTDSSLNMTVYDWMLETGKQIDAGKKVVVTELTHARIPIVTAAQC